MTEKVKIITPESGLSLDALDVKPGELAGFYNTNQEMPQPFMIAFVGERGLSRRVGDEPSNNGHSELLLDHNLKNDGPGSVYSLDSPQGFLQIFDTFLYGGLRFFGFGIRGSTLRIPYLVEYAYAGGDEIVKALKKSGESGFDFYANWLEFELGRTRDRR